MASNSIVTVAQLAKNNEKIKEQLTTKVNIEQGVDNKGKLLGIDDNGKVTVVDKPDSVKISAETGNIITQKTDGLFADDTIVEIQVDGTPLTITDKKVNLTGFITKAVNDLENYYLKTETYNKEEVDNLLKAISTLKISKVDTLPTTDISTTVIYLLPKTDTDEKNIYAEYINLDGTENGWECIGDTKVDLTEYAKTTEVEKLIENAVYTTTTVEAHYEIADNTTANALEVVANGTATDGQIDISSVTPLPDGVTVTEGDYVVWVEATETKNEKYVLSGTVYSKDETDEKVADSHTHNNKSVLDKLSETDEGILLFNGSKIQGGGEDVVIPYIGDNGNWYVNENDTGVPATGQDGMSAYEVAVAFNGFVGTEQEWLNSLKGADGISPIVNIGGNGNWFVDGVDTGISAKGEKGDTGQGFSATKHYNTIDEMMSDTEPANESEVVVVINGDVGNFYLRLSSYVDPDGITNGYLPIGNTEDISAIQGEKGEDGATPVIDPNTKHWFIDGIDTGVVAEGANGVTPHIGANGNWFIGETDTGILAKGKDGRSIVSIVKDDNNNIIVTFSDNTTENIGELSVDIQGDFLAENGFGNLRYYEGKFQYYDTATSAWIDTSVSPENVYIMQMMPQTMESFDGLYDIDLGKNKLRWKEPKDTIIDGQVCCIVEKVVIRRKLGSTPLNETDGDLVIEVGRSEFGSYTTTYFVDKALTPTLNEVWYYKAFPISTTGFCNSSSINEKSILCKDYHLYGFKLDQNESDPSSMITYLSDCDNSGYKSAYMDYTTGLFNYSDWGNTWFIRDLKPCMLNYDGTVAYELNKDDYTLKADGTASDIANDAFGGNAMIGFPKVYWKIVDNGDNTANVYFSDKKVDEDFVCWSHIDNNGNEIDYCYMPIYNGSNVSSVLRSISGKAPMAKQTATTEITYAKANNIGSDVIWYTELFNDRMLINLLLLLIGKSTNTQAVFGTGNNNSYVSSSDTGIKNTGTMNTKGLFWGNRDNVSGVKVFGMEHWYGNIWRRIGGCINDNGIQKFKMTYGQSDGSTVDGYNETGSGYISIGNSTPSGTSGGYISKMTVTKNGLIPTTASGSATTYYCDGLWFDNSQVSYAIVGCRSHYTSCVGAFALNYTFQASYKSTSFNATLSCKPLAPTT